MKTLLIVEDEPAIADTVEYAFSTDGFSVTRAATAAEALACLAKTSFVLAIIDVGLPDKNGFELYKELQLTYSLPVLFLTARADEIDRVLGLELGADDYVVKPFSPRELVARAKAILRRTGGAAPLTQGENEPQTPQAFSVDANRHAISYHGQTLELSRYEFKLLQTLLSHPGWVYSRDRLMELVWDDPMASMERTVDAHIKTLRAKLKLIRPGEDPIVTHRGVGYSLKEKE
jgi:two-component system catabolic regulation response regulator CreB